MRWTSLSLMTALALAGASTLEAPRAAAQAATDDEAALEQARKLFRDGLDLEAAGDYARALAIFEQVARTRMSPAVRFHIALCKERLGRWTEALGGYRLALHEATAQSPVDDQVAMEAQAARERLEPRIPMVRVVLGRGLETATVTLDGVRVGQALLHDPIAIDPGAHEVLAELSDGRKVAKAFEATEGQSQEVQLLLLADEDPFEEPATAPATSDGGDEADARTQKKSPWPWVIGGVGVGALGASGAFFALSSNAETSLKSQCLDGLCPESARSDKTDAETYRTVAAVSLGVGAALVVTSVVLLTSRGKGRGPEGAAQAASFTLEARPEAGGAGLRLHGRF